MENEDAEERFDRLAKAALQELCNAHQGTIKAVYLDVDRSQEYSYEEKELFKRRLDHAILFCNNFKYFSDEGQADYGSFLHLACFHQLTYLVREVVHDHEKTFGKKVDRKTLRDMMGRKSRRLRRTLLHETVRHLPCFDWHVQNLCFDETDAFTVALDEKDCDGKTPLHLARLTDVSWAAKLLGYASEHGLLHVVHATDSRGMTPADLAIEEGWIFDYVRAVLSLTYSTSAMSADTTTESSAPDRSPARCRAVFDVQKSTVRKLFEYLMPDVRHIPKDILTRINRTLNQAIDSCGLPTQHAAIDRHVAGDPLRVEEFEVLSFMLDLSELGWEGVGLQFDRIAIVLNEAVRQASPRMIQVIYKLSRPSDIKRLPEAYLICCEAGSVDNVERMCSKDPVTVAHLDSVSMSVMLRRAVQHENSSLLAALCTHCTWDGLYTVDTSTLNAVFDSLWMHASQSIAKFDLLWMHALQGTISRLVKSASMRDLAKASFTRQKPTVQADILLKMLETLHPDPVIITMYTTNEVVSAIPSATCDKIVGMLMDKLHLLSLDEVSKSGLLHKTSQNIKRKVLLKCAEHGQLELASTCVEEGALHGLTKKSMMNPSPVAVAKENGHDRLARMLQKALDDQNLLSFGDQPVDSVLVRVGGPPGAGKSTLVESLKQTRLQGAVRLESQPDEGDRNYLTRTKGINVHVYKDDTGTPYHILDLGGHDDFAVAHQLFIGQGEVPIINTIVISSLSERAELQKEMMKWCAFYASRCRPQPVLPSEGTLSTQLRQPVIIIATRLGAADTVNKKNVINSFDRSKLRYGKFLDFLDGPVFVDARKSWSNATRILREHLATVKKNLLSKEDLRQPALSGDIQRALPNIRKTVKGPLMLRNDFMPHFGRALSSSSHAFDEKVLASHEEIVDAVLRKMSDAAEIISFQKPELAKYLVVEPQWLLSHIVGILMSPENFPAPRVLYHHGRTKRSLAEAAVANRHVPGNDTLEMVAQLGLCILEEEDMIVPSKLDTEREPTTWTSRRGLDMYFGIRLVCQKVPLSPAVFPQLQVHLYNKFLALCGQVSKLWKDGIHVTLHYSNAEGLLEAQRDQMAINVAVRGSSRLARDAHQLLQLLREQVLYIAEEFSPGSDLSVKILSSAELHTLAEKGSTEAPTAFYEEEDVKNAMERAPSLIRPRDGSGESEDAFSLMVLPPTHLLLMSHESRALFCTVMNGGGVETAGRRRRRSSWRDLVQRLNLLMVSAQFTAATTNPTSELLEAWSRQSAHNTVERLLEAVTAMQHRQSVAILENELLQMKNATLTVKAGVAGKATSPGTASSNKQVQQTMSTQPPGEALPETCSSLPVETVPQLDTREATTKVVADNKPADDSVATIATAVAIDSNHLEEIPSGTDRATSPTESTMLEISACFKSHFDCERLAVYLELSQESGYVRSLQSSDPHSTPHQVAFRVMCQWVLEKGSAATGQKLYDVLRDCLQMVSVAERFEVELLN